MAGTLEAQTAAAPGHGTVTPSEKAAKVPKKYLVLGGDYAEHPGEGL